MKNLKRNIKNYPERLPQDKKLIYRSLISLKRKKKSLKFNPDLQHKARHLMQIKINVKEFRQNRGLLVEVKIKEINKAEVQLDRII